MRPTLTKKKREWAKNRNVVLRGGQLNYNASTQEKYVNELEKLINLMTSEVKKSILNLFQSEESKEYFKNQQKISAMDASLSSMAKKLMNELTKKFNSLFSYKSKILSERMINNIKKSSKTNLHQSLKELSGGLSLKTGIVTKGTEEVSKALISENVSLIKSIPQEYFKDVTGFVMRSITEGNGLKDLIPQLHKHMDKTKKRTKRRAELLALDQTRKAYNTINKQRLVSLGVKQFEWLHSGGSQKPRESHKKISHHIFSFENLEKEQAALGVPEEDRGLPGMPVNCKCTLRAVIKFED